MLLLAVLRDASVGLERAAVRGGAPDPWRSRTSAPRRTESMIKMYGNCGIGMKQGDSRYMTMCDDCLQKTDTIARVHVSRGISSERLPPNLRPGQRLMVDGGDATVRSKFGLHRYFLVFICCKSAKKIIYYMRDNSAKSFVAAALYVRRLIKI